MSRLSQSFLVLLSMFVLSCVLFAVPWTTSKLADVTVYGVIGGTVAILLIRELSLISVTSKKLPNGYKSCPKMLPLEK